MRWFPAIAAVLWISGSAQAHRLDEYLQATRIAVRMNQLELSIDLTPGVEVVQDVLSSIDPGKSPHISPRQAEAYTERVLRDVRLDLDGKPQALTLVRSTFPAREEMEQGEGVIQLKAIATIPKLRTGQHEIVFHNNHLPKISVYLANALIPGDKAVTIRGQSRDAIQREFRLSFTVGQPTAADSPKAGNSNREEK